MNLDRSEILNQVAMRRTATGTKTARKTPTTKWLFPKPISIQYQRILVAHVEQMTETTMKVLGSMLENVVQQRDFEYPALVRKDSFQDSATRLIEALRIGLNAIPFPKSLIAQNIGQKTSEWNDYQWRKTMKNVIGVAIPQREPFLDPVLNAFTKTNVALITQMEADYLTSVEGIIQRGLISGASHKSIAQQIIGDKGLFKELKIGAPSVPVKGTDLVTKTKNRAKFLARDQVGKLNGNLTMLRQANLGIEKYIWRTSGDERVRPTHSANDGKTFSWNNPPAETGHVGQDFSCRCSAEPIFDDVIEEILA